MGGTIAGISGGGPWAAWVPALPARQERPVRFWLLGVAGAVLAGFFVGLVLYELVRPRGQAAAPDEGWGELGAALEGAAAGVLACVIAWLVLLVVYLRRYLAPASQLAAGAASVGLVLAGAVVLAAMGTVLASLGGSATANPGPWSVAGAVQGAGLGGLAAPPVVVQQFRRRGRG